MKTGDPFIPEDLFDFKWAFTSFGFLYIYHFLPLQFLAYHSQVNLNNMLCPAVSDPFHGKYYRLFAICHQIILIPTLGKVFVILAKAFKILPCNDLPDAPISEVFSNNCIVDCPQEPPPCFCPSKPPSCCSEASESCCQQDSFHPVRTCVSVHKNESCLNRQSCDKCSDSGISSSGVGCNNRNKDRSYPPSNVSSVSCCLCDNTSMPGTVGKCKSSCCVELPPNGMDDGKNSLVRASRTSVTAADTRESCSAATQPPAASTTTTACTKSCGEGDLGMPAYVTRRLVNGKVTNGCQQQQQAVTTGVCGSRSKNCGEDGSCRSRHRSGSGSRRRGSHNDGDMSMSELDGRNGHAKAH